MPVTRPTKEELIKSYSVVTNLRNWRVTRIATGEAQAELTKDEGKTYVPQAKKPTLKEAQKYIRQQAALYQTKIDTVDGPVVIFDYGKEK